VKFFITVLLLVSSVAFAQKSKKTIESEKKQIEELEKQLEQKKAALALEENNKSEKLKAIEAQRKALDAKEAELKSEMAKDQEQVSAVQCDPVVEQPAKVVLQKRNWFFDGGSTIFSMLNNTYSIEGTQNTRDRNGSEFNLEVGYNFGSVELSPVLSYSKYNFTSYSIDSEGYGMALAYNFIENKPGQDIVPFVATKYLTYTENYDYNPIYTSESDYTVETKTTIFSAGIKYFPFSQFVALKGELQQYMLDGEYTEKNFPADNYDIKGLRLKGSAFIYF
jgi:hypothetical protein